MAIFITLLFLILFFNILIFLSLFFNQRQNQMNHQELADALNTANTKVDKIITEIQALKDALANADNVPAGVQDAATALFSNLQVADDLNADA